MQSTSRFNDADDYNECLVTLVQARRALYDHRVPVKERTALKKKALWNEVVHVLGGTFPFVHMLFVSVQICIVLHYFLCLYFFSINL